MHIIDFEKKGNVIRFFLGADDVMSYEGDNWDVVPYEHNASKVYPSFIETCKDIVVPFDDIVLEPCDGAYTSNSEYSKLDMKSGKIPCIIVIPYDVLKYMDKPVYDFNYWLSRSGVGTRYFFNQKM